MKAWHADAFQAVYQNAYFYLSGTSGTNAAYVNWWRRKERACVLECKLELWYFYGALGHTGDIMEDFYPYYLDLN